VKGKHVSEQARYAHTAAKEDMAASMKRIQAFMDRQRQDAGPKPRHFKKPPYGTPEYRRAHACGWGSVRFQSTVVNWLERTAQDALVRWS
jgi:hypothetical protein